MATLDNIRAAGFNVQIAWQGWTAPDGQAVPTIYTISNQNTLTMLPDEPDALDTLLRQPEQPPDGSIQPPVPPSGPPQPG